MDWMAIRTVGRSTGGPLFDPNHYFKRVMEFPGLDSVLAVQFVYGPPLFDGVLRTLRAAFPRVREYAVWVHSFVKASFGLCGLGPLELTREIPAGMRYPDAP